MQIIKSASGRIMQDENQYWGSGIDVLNMPNNSVLLNKILRNEWLYFIWLACNHARRGSYQEDKNGILRWFVKRAKCVLKAELLTCKDFINAEAKTNHFT